MLSFKYTFKALTHYNSKQNSFTNSWKKDNALCFKWFKSIVFDSYICPHECILYCTEFVPPTANFSSPGALADISAPFSAICATKIKLLDHESGCNIGVKLKLLDFAQYETWQYVSGSHARANRRILVFSIYYVLTSEDNRISYRYDILFLWGFPLDS